MKHILTSAIIIKMALFLPGLQAQNLQKANKEFELYAFNLAIKSYQEVIAAEPNNVEALSKIGSCHFHLNQIDQAVNWYQKAVKVEGVNPETYFQLGQALMNQGNYAEARNWFLTYAETNPDKGAHYAGNCDFAISMQGVSALYRVKREYLNEAAADFGAAFYSDQVVYASSRTDIKRGNDKQGSNWTGEAKNQLFITSQDENGYLRQPVFLRSDFSNDYGVGPVSYSGDGKWVAYTKNNFVNGTRQIPSSGMEMSIYIAEVIAGGDWRDAKPFAHNGSGFSSGFTYLNEDGTKMYFASNRPEGYGGYDLYVSVKTGNSWSTPKNLGPTVNSPGNEITPFVENGTLYFASDWHAGLGGFDIFKATQTSGNWSNLTHLGNTVNSSHDDYGLIYNSRHNLGYFTSNRPGGKGNEDIYQFSQLSDKVLISVRNAANNQPVAGASIDFSACGEPVFYTDEKGQYSFEALPGLSCETVVKKEGFIEQRFTLVSDGRKKAQNIDITLTREADRYFGKVVNATNNRSVGEVRIRVTDQQTGERTETITDENGNYDLALQPNRTYFIRFSKAGFVDTQNMVSTANEGMDKTILGVISFMPSTTQLDNMNVDTPTEEAASGISSSEIVEEEEVLMEGFAVQIAASQGDQPVNTAMFKGLENLGNLYSRPENGFKKVRVGIFENREEAEDALKKINQKGFPKAFIVKENLEDTEGVEVYDLHREAENTTNARTTVKEETALPEETTPSGSTETTEYMVRLAAYKNLSFFDASKVSDLGVIEQRRSGDFTIIFLTGFSSPDAAKRAKEIAFSKGFHGAYVVTNVNGEIKKVNL